MGHPEKDLPGLVQIVGTNGKGTTALALAVALEKMGNPSGAYLSPHVLSYTERVVLHGGQVSEEDFAAAMGETIELADRNGIPASQFELLTAGALGMFAAAGLSWAVLEAGLGARHDATSVVRPDAVVLTNVSIDHTEYLGVTVEEIAEEKLASLRPGATLFLGTAWGKVGSARRSRQKCNLPRPRAVRSKRRATGDLGGRVTAGKAPPYRGRAEGHAGCRRGTSRTVRSTRG
jgi:dihydrofolate synthase/folylpolyglutamate synthase